MKLGKRFLPAILLFALILTGCWDKVELDDIAWVQAMGFDKGADGQILTTFVIGIPRLLQGGGGRGGGGGSGDGSGGPGPHHTTVTVQSKTVIEAIALAAINLGRRLSLQHTELYLFGEELAISDIRFIVGAIDRYREVRGSAYIMVARPRAEDVLRVDVSPLEVSPSRYILTLAQQHMQTGLFETVFLVDFVNSLESEDDFPSCPIISLSRSFKQEGSTESGKGGGGGGQGGEGQKGQQGETQFPPTPRVGDRIQQPGLPPGLSGPQGGPMFLEGGQVPRVGGGPVEAMGTAVFRGGKMVGDLNGEETRTMLMVKGDFERGFFAVPDPQVPDQSQYSLSLDMRGRKTKVEVNRQGDRVEIDVHLTLEVSYMSMKTQSDYTDPRMEPLVEKAAAEYVKKNLDRAIMRTQEMGADVFGFGRRLRRTFLTWPEYEAFAWQSKYPQAEIRTNVEVELKRYGLDFGPLKVTPGEKLQESQ